jgi:hypothetical protein
MFENEIKFVSDFTLNKVKELGSFITVEKLLSTDIHPSIKKYVEGEIDFLIYEDRKKLIENSLFDYSGKEISKYFYQIGVEIKKTKKISYEDIKNIILQAVSFNANYVVRPKWSLSKLIFGNNKSVSINEIQLMFSYTYYFEYLNNVFLAYLSKKKILNISVTEFELIMNKIDRELFMLHQSKLVDNALYAIADYFSIGGLNKSSVTVESVENFLKEKNLTELLFKLKRAYANSGKKKVDIDEVRKVLYSTLSIDSPFVEETETEPEEVTQEKKHFDNPLKDNFIAEEISEVEEESETKTTRNILDLSEDAETKTKEFIEERTSIIENTEQILENIDLDVDNRPETDVEKAIEQSEPQKFELDTHLMTEETVPQKKSILNDDFIAETTSKDPLDTLDELLSEDKTGHKIDETEDNRTLNEEEFLTSLTEEIEKSNDEEIIILDEKEQEDLLNFYDNELEISIDDEVDLPNKKDEKIDSVISDMELEHEVSSDQNSEDGISLDKIDFENELAQAEPKMDRQETERKLKSSIKIKSSDIFTYLTNKEIDKIIKNLFNSDSEDFANTVERMSDCTNYEEASLILDSVFKYARIKPHSKDAKLLSDAVSKYFNVDI